MFWLCLKGQKDKQNKFCTEKFNIFIATIIDELQHEHQMVLAHNKVIINKIFYVIHIHEQNENEIKYIKKNCRDKSTQKDGFSCKINNLLRLLRKEVLGIGFKILQIEIVTHHTETVIKNINDKLSIGRVLVGNLIVKNILCRFINKKYFLSEVLIMC